MSQLSANAQYSQFSGLGNGTGFPNPFSDIASLSMPSNQRSMLYWAEFIASYHGTFRMALERIASYFLTDIAFPNAEEDETDKWSAFTKDTLKLLQTAKSMMRNRLVYGNSFASMLKPFKRFLRCPRCSYSVALSEAYTNSVFKFSWNEPEFHATCPVCKVGAGYSGKFAVDDRDDDIEKKLKVKIWNPHEIELLHDPYSEDTAYLWRIPEDYKRLIHQGHLYHLERAPLEVIKAVHQNQMYRFNPDALYHMKEPTLAGIYNRGWGIPRIFSNFRQIYHVQVLHRCNEAIALDYVIPFRVITPAPSRGGGAGGGAAVDPNWNLLDGRDFRNYVMQMIRRRRKDPAAFQVLPLPVQFQMFGADAAKLAPRELLDQANEKLLNDIGVPIELYNGSLQLQTAPVALRLFESTFYELVHDTNEFLNWSCEQASEILSWEAVSAELKRVTIADNLEQQSLNAQLMMSQQLSATTVLDSLGYRWRKEQKQIAEESRFQAELQARTQEEQQQAGVASQMAKGQQAQGGPAGGGGAQGGQQAAAGGQAQQGQPQQGQGPVSQYLAGLSPDAPISLTDMLQVADTMAQDLLGQPSAVSNSELKKLKTYNSALHGLVKERMDALRSGIKSQAGNAAMGQIQQGGGQPQQ